MAPESLSRAQMQVAVTAFAALFAVVGLALYGLPYFYDFMVQDFGWTRTQVTSGNAYSKLLVGPLFGFLAGWMVDRFGPRRLMVSGIAMAGLALLGLGFTSSLGAFYVFYLFNALGYVCGGPLPSQVLLSRWFDRSRGKVMGFAYLGIGIGGAVVPVLSMYLVAHFGWQPALRILGVLIIVSAMPLALFVKDAPDEWAAARRGTMTGSEHSATSILPVLRQWPFYLLLIASMSSIGAVGGMMQNLKLYMSLDLQIAQEEIAPILSLVLGGSLAGRLLFGWFADWWPKKYVMFTIYSLVALAIPVLLVAESRAGLYVFALLFGVALGGDYMIIPLMAAELFGVAVLGRVMGIVLTADGVAEALAPMAVAAIRDHAGSYAPGFSALMVLGAIGATAVAMLPSPREPARDSLRRPNNPSATPA